MSRDDDEDFRRLLKTLFPTEDTERMLHEAKYGRPQTVEEKALLESFLSALAASKADAGKKKEIEKTAREGRYSDFSRNAFLFPKLRLAMEVRKAGDAELAKRVENGEFDF